MKGLRNLAVLKRALVFSAESKDFAGRLVIELEELAVGSESVEDALADIKEEGSTWLDSVLLLQSIETGVGEEHQLVSGGVLLIEMQVLL